MNEIYLYGEIGWESRAKDIVEQLKELEGDITLRVNSPGGDVYDGLAIMNVLRGHAGTVTAVIEGYAASAASFIVAGGADRVVARPNAEIMIHDAWTWPDGNADQLRKAADDLDRLSDNIASIYAEKAGGDAAEFRALMKQETWFSAEEAHNVGLVDAIEDARQPTNAGVKQPVFAKALSRFKYAGRAAAPAPTIVAQNGQEGDTVGILNQLAQEMGKKPEEVKSAFSGFFNEQAEVTAPVSIEYPDEVTVVPTGQVAVSPVTALPEGVVPTVEIGEGFSAEVADDGTVTVTSTDAVSVGDTVDLVLTFGEDSMVTVKVTVVAASGDDSQEAGGDVPAPAEPAPSADDVVVVPRAFYDELTKAHAMNRERIAELEERDREKEIDAWIDEGRFSAGSRAAALAAHKKNPEEARRVWGNLPKGSISRSEKGYATTTSAKKASNQGKVKAKAAKPFPSVRY